MPSIIVFYYSQTGNTEKMAKAIEAGANNIQGVIAELRYYATPEELASFDAIVVGTPTYHHDMTFDIKNLFEEAAVESIALSDKIGAAFGSYGWSGEAPRLVLEIMKHKFGMHVIEPPLLLKYAPNQAGLEKCREYGEKIANKLIHPT